MFWRLIWVVLWTVGWPTWADARTLAVLPLEKPPSAQGPEGLGEALAGMLVSDLIGVPGLVLVERQRLDAVLAEIQLGEQGYLDPSTAARAGRGVGAADVLVGTYAVIEGQLTIEARWVSVSTGKISTAASATGPLADFVAVEKLVAEALIARLDVVLSPGERRKLQVSSITESVDAATAWGAGIAAERAGKLADARAAYQRAIASDPTFSEAREALDGLASALSTSKQRTQTAEDARRSPILDVLIAAASKLPPQSPQEPTEILVNRVLGWMARTERGDDCAVAEEVGAWFLARKGAPGPPNFSMVLHERLRVTGFGPLPMDVAGPPLAHRSPHERAARYLKGSTVLGLDRITEADEGDGWMGSTLRCARGAARPAAVANVLRQITEAELANTPEPGWGSWKVGLDVAWAWQQAEHLGPSAELTRRVEELAAFAEQNPSLRVGITAMLDQIQRRARTIALRNIRRDGVDEAELLRFARALQDGGPPLRATPGVCTTAADFERSRGAVILGSYQTAAPGSEVQAFNLDMIADQRRVFARLGCLDGSRPAFTDVEGGRAWALARLERPLRADPVTCDGTLAQIRQQTSDGVVGQVTTWPAGPPAWMWTLVTLVVVAEGNGCISPTR